MSNVKVDTIIFLQLVEAERSKLFQSSLFDAKTWMIALVPIRSP